MKIGELKELENGELDIEVIFDSEDEKLLYLARAIEEGLSLNDFFIKIMTDHAKDKNNDGK